MGLFEQDLQRFPFASCVWGSKFSKIGNQQTHLVDNEISGQSLITKIIKTRKNHGYQLVEK